MLEDMHPALQQLAAQGCSIEEIVQLEAEMEDMMPTYEAMNAIHELPDMCKVMFDSGTFAHMFGTGTHHMLKNRRAIPPMPISTANGIGWVKEMADLEIGKFKATDGYVNHDMNTTLLSEGVLEKKDGWKFASGGDQGRICITPVGGRILVSSP